MTTLAEAIELQRTAALAHRLRLGLGEYKAMTRQQMLDELDANAELTHGEPVSDLYSQIFDDEELAELVAALNPEQE